MTYTKEEVIRRLRKNQFDGTLFLVGDSNESVYVIPCSFAEIKSVDDIDFIQIQCSIPWYSCNTIDELVDKLNNYQKNLNDLEEDRSRCKQYFESHQKSEWDDSSWEYYSDWHKDLFGYRPHAKVFGKYVSPY